MDRWQVTNERTAFFRTIIEERNTAIDRLTEENGALQVQLANALRERDALAEIAGSLQEIIADHNAEIAELKRTMARCNSWFGGGDTLRIPAKAHNAMNWVAFAMELPEVDFE